MKKTGAWLATYALEQLGVRFTFGIPGVHTTELYDELNSSKQITPILVTHEGGGAFMADAVSRLSDSVGVLAVVPAAGLTHAASGIGEAFLDGVPMLVICGGPRTDTSHQFQLHQMDMRQFMSGLTKATFKVANHEELVPTLFNAHAIATGGEPGPVFIEIPVNILIYSAEAGPLPRYTPPKEPALRCDAEIERAVELLCKAKNPALFVGWGARDAFEQVKAVAEWLEAPVATTLQGLSVFPANHPLHVGFGFGASAVPAARHAFKDCDCLLAVGTRFSEIATGSYGVTVPENLVHIDINPQTIGANYPAKVGIVGDAARVLRKLHKALLNTGLARPLQRVLRAKIQSDKLALRTQWYKSDAADIVNPARFFDQLRAHTPDDAILVVDDGNHTFLTAELMPIHAPKSVILPTDFNCMGYAVPAAIGAKLAHPGRLVQAIVGDGAFLMTCMEILTAQANQLGVVYYVFNDGSLSQIAQAQDITYNRKPCTELGYVNLEGVALATGATYIHIANNDAIAAAVQQAIELATTGRPVIVDVNIDYSKRTSFTEGAVKTNFQRFPLDQKVRTLTRAVTRRITG